MHVRVRRCLMASIVQLPPGFCLFFVQRRLDEVLPTLVSKRMGNSGRRDIARPENFFFGRIWRVTRVRLLASTQNDRLPGQAESLNEFVRSPPPACVMGVTWSENVGHARGAQLTSLTIAAIRSPTRVGCIDRCHEGTGVSRFGLCDVPISALDGISMRARFALPTQRLNATGCGGGSVDRISFVSLSTG